VLAISLLALIMSALTLAGRFHLALARVAAQSAPAETRAAEPPLLDAGQLTERELSATESHSYRVQLEKGQYVHILVEKTSVHLSLRLSAPDGRLVVKLEGRDRESTPVSAIADSPGFYRLEIRSLETDGTRGRYALRVADIRVATTKDNQTTGAEKTFAEGEQLLREWKAESSRLAIERFRESLSLWRVAGERGEEAHAFKRIGDVFQRFGESKQALDSYKQSLAIWRALKNRSQEAETLNEMGYVHLNRGENQKAQELCSEGLRLSQVTENIYGKARALNNLGEISYGLGRLQESLEFFQKALGLWRQAGDRKGQALALLNFAYTHSDIGQMREALDYYNQALALWISARDKRGEAMTLTAVGRLYSRMGESQQALNYFEQAMRLIEPIGAPAEKGRVLTGLADVYNQLSKKKEAIEYYNQALPLFRAAGDYSGEVVSIYDAADVLYSLGENEKALSYYQQALSISRVANDRRLQAFEIRQIGRVYASLGDERKALENYLKALAFLRTEKDFRGEADTLNAIAGIWEQRGETQKARDYYDRALSLSRQADYRTGEAATLYNIAHLARDRGDLSEARSRAAEALEVVESLRGKVASQDLRSSYFASVRQQYEFYIDLLMALHRQRPNEGFDTAAFEASERARARSLLETLTVARVGIRSKAEPALLERESSLRNQLNETAERQMRLSPGAAAEASALDKEIRELTFRLSEVEALIRAGSTEHTGSLPIKPLDLKAIQERVVSDDTLLLQYSLGEDRSYLWLVSKTTIESFELPNRTRIEMAARNVYDSLTANQPLPGKTLEQQKARVVTANEQLPTQIANLSKILLEPVSSKLGTKRLLIVADGALQYIPFQILTKPAHPNSAGSEINAATAESRQLVTDHEIVNQASASALALLIGDTSTRAQPSNSVAVFADPVFELDDPRITSVNSPKMEVMTAELRETELRRALRDVGLTENGARIPRLLASRDEAEAIMAAAPWWSGFKAMGFEANRATAMTSDLADYRIVHFATHGFLNDEHPELSGVVLSLFDEKGQAQEGFLRLHDIYNLKLPVDLVVLSACNTGLGKEVKGEGLIGLTRGFMYAGASSVVASLWKVDDDATAVLMGYFYGYMLKDGLSPAAALRKAQLEMSKQKRWQSPYYWSAFTIQGQYLPAAKAKYFTSTRMVMWGGVAAVLAIAGFFVWRVRRSRVL
jgi:CHAT domain-containing protein/Tfp pilus assembly protein PilF